MFNEVTTVIDQERCTGCGTCVEVCPLDTITLQGDKAVVTGNSSLNCGHCMAACPEEAITVKAIDQSWSTFSTFKADHRWMRYGDFDTAQLVRLMASRRSCRNFKNKPVDRSILEDLVKIGITAPSGTNCQLWTFTIFPTRQAVQALAERIAQFFERLNSMAEKTLLRKFLKLVGKPELDRYYKEYYETVKEGLAEAKISSRDKLFYGAPSLIIVGSKPGASTPKEDCMLASQNILLAAHSMGFGSCLIGMAVQAMQNDQSILRFLGIPKEEKIYAIIALGYPNEAYRAPAGRRQPEMRYFEG
jgi:nitroreductase/NAD-dependent dihydropyrimidine dehydrogenase PreA subunit